MLFQLKRWTPLKKRLFASWTLPASASAGPGVGLASSCSSEAEPEFRLHPFRLALDDLLGLLLRVLLIRDFILHTRKA